MLFVVYRLAVASTAKVIQAAYRADACSAGCSVAHGSRQSRSPAGGTPTRATRRGRIRWFTAARRERRARLPTGESAQCVRKAGTLGGAASRLALAMGRALASKGEAAEPTRVISATLALDRAFRGRQLKPR